MNESSYIICSTPRSGSTLLCDLLTDTKIAGRPNSFFMDEFYSDWALYFDVSIANWNDSCDFDSNYLNAALIEGAGGTDVFGMRLQWESLEKLSFRLKNFYPTATSDSELFAAAFNTSHYIHISRKDKIAQAISLLKAEQSGLWHIHSDGTERERLKNGDTPVYDEKALSNFVAELNDHEAAWLEWFEKQNVYPISITYEELSVEPQLSIAKILSYLGLNPNAANMIEPRTAKLSNEESQKWADRFRNSKSN